MWLERGLQIMRSLGLPASSDVASDPFFGRGGKMLAANQRTAKLKFEVLVPVISEEKPTAVCSFNWHQEHFGQDLPTFAARRRGRSDAACLGLRDGACVHGALQALTGLITECLARRGPGGEKLWPTA